MSSSISANAKVGIDRINKGDIEVELKSTYVEIQCQQKKTGQRFFAFFSKTN
jgi:hypothetical protein